MWLKSIAFAVRYCGPETLSVSVMCSSRSYYGSTPPGLTATRPVLTAASAAEADGPTPVVGKRCVRFSGPAGPVSRH